MLTQNRLKELLTYNPDTGLFGWVSKHGLGRGRPRRDGLSAGTNSHGYISICIDGTPYFAHRLAFLFVDGELPSESVDHINHNRSDNSWGNLRCVSHSENHKNRKMDVRNTHGITGVVLDKRWNSWYSTIYGDRKKIYLGSTKDFFEACCARKSAENKYGYHENHGLNAAEVGE